MRRIYCPMPKSFPNWLIIEHREMPCLENKWVVSKKTSLSFYIKVSASLFGATIKYFLPQCIHQKVLWSQFHRFFAPSPQHTPCRHSTPGSPGPCAWSTRAGRSRRSARSRPPSTWLRHGASLHHGASALGWRALYHPRNIPRFHSQEAILTNRFFSPPSSLKDRRVGLFETTNCSTREEILGTGPRQKWQNHFRWIFLPAWAFGCSLSHPIPRCICKCSLPILKLRVATKILRRYWERASDTMLRDDVARWRWKLTSSFSAIIGWCVNCHPISFHLF